MKKRVIVGVLVAVVAIGALAVCLSKGKGAEKAVPVSITKAEIREMVSYVEAKGNVKLKEPVRIYASNNGKIKKVLVSEGDYVKKGQVLFTYDEDNTDSLNNQLDDARLTVKQLKEEIKGLSLPTDQSEIKSTQAQITQYESTLKELDYGLEIDEENVRKAQTDLERAKDNYNKNKQLYDGGVISKNDFDTYSDALTAAETTLNNAQTQLEKDSLSRSGTNASLEAAREKLKELESVTSSQRVQNEISSRNVQLEMAQLKVSQLEEELAKYKECELAPFDGRVSAVNQNDGATVLEDTSVLEMVNENDTVIYLDIPESEMPGIKEGLDVKLTGDGFEGEISAKIKSLKFEAEKKEIDNTQKNVVEAELEVADRTMLRPGYTLKGKVIKSVNSNAVAIPVMAYLTDGDGKDFVYVVNGESKLEKKEITIGEYEDMYIEAKGLKQGEQIVDTPDENILREGLLVEDSQETTTEGAVDHD